MTASIDMTGRTCGELTVIERAPGDGSKKVKWRCACSCGGEAIVDGSKLRNGRTRSCGHLNALGSSRRDIVQRFVEKTMTTDAGCIVWTGGLNGAGYGQFYVGRSDAGQTGKGYAHRFSYEAFVGPIPEGLHIDHLCRNPACVNPDHLEPVTIRENLLRGVGPSAENAVKTHCPAGHPYSGDNLYVHPTKGMRFCRTCGRNHAREYRTRAIREQGKDT